MEDFLVNYFYETSARPFCHHDIIFSCYDPEDAERNIGALREAYGYAMRKVYDSDVDAACKMKELFFRWHYHRDNLHVYLRRDIDLQTIANIRYAWVVLMGSDTVHFVYPGDPEGESYRADFHPTHKIASAFSGTTGVTLSKGANIGTVAAAVDWAKTNCPTFHTFLGHAFYFGDEEEAALFKMRW